MRVRTRPLYDTECPRVDDGGLSLSAEPRRSGLDGSRHDPSRIELRALRATRKRAAALTVVSLLSVLAIVAVGLGSAVGLASPLSRTPANTSGTDAASQSHGFAGALGPLDALQGTRMPVANTQGSTRPSTEKSVRSDRPFASADAAVAQAIAPKPSAEIHPIAIPSASTVAAASLAAAAAGSSSPRVRGTITIETFGYSFGEPSNGCAFVADVRNIDTLGFAPNETGLMPSVRERVMATAEAQAWLAVFRSEWMPALKDGDKVAIGCSKGHHRSVTLGAIFAEDLRAQGFTVNLVHRDILKTW